MPISWNEIRHNSHAFAKEWADESSEHAEAKSFWDAFFTVFGIKRRTVASFEEPVKKLSGNWGHIDLFWPGKMLVEHKSRDKSLDKANSQAMEYLRGLKDAGRDEEIPRYIVLSDFARIALYDLEEEQEPIKFPLRDLYKHVHAFAFIPGYKQHKLEAEDPINIQAVELLGKLHDALEEGGHTGHDLERFLVRSYTINVVPDGFWSPRICSKTSQHYGLFISPTTNLAHVARRTKGSFALDGRRSGTWRRSIHGKR
jgi:hypothetical protein